MEKIIWKLWLQGWDKAPRVVKECRDSWERLNPDWEIIYLDRKNISCYVDIEYYLNNKKLTPQALSDILRIYLLQLHGGVWIDATVWCAKPLSSWIFEKNNKGFLSGTTHNPKDKLSSWFFASEPNGYMINTFVDEMRNYWEKRNKAHKYMWIHSLFMFTYHKHERFRKTVDDSNKVYSLPCLKMKANVAKDFGTTVDEEIKNPKEYFYKLNWKRNIPGLEKLFEQNRI